MAGMTWCERRRDARAYGLGFLVSADTMSNVTSHTARAHVITSDPGKTGRPEGSTGAGSG